MGALSEKEMFSMENLDAVYAQHLASEYDQKPASKRLALKKLDRRAKRPAP